MIRKFLGEVGVFLGEAFLHWQSWVSGGGVAGAGFILLMLWERMTGRAMDNRTYIFILLSLFFIGASFVAWRSRYRELRLLQERFKSPELPGVMGPVVSGNYGQGSRDVVVLVGLSIRNPVGPPSALYNWAMTIEIAGPRTLTGEVPPGFDQELSVGLANGETMVVDPTRFVGRMTNQPVPAGGIISGWFWTVFRDIRQDRLYEDQARITVSFCDAVTGKQHVITGSFKEPGVHIPGLPRKEDLSILKAE